MAHLTWVNDLHEILIRKTSQQLMLTKKKNYQKLAFLKILDSQLNFDEKALESFADRLKLLF